VAWRHAGWYRFRLSPTELVLHDANQSRLDELVRPLSGSGRGRVDSGRPDPTGYDIVINATPMGMSPNDPLPVPAHLLTASIIVGDLVAGHGITPLLQAAQGAGCKTADGRQMVEAGMDLMPNFFLGVPGST
jgi:shikimate dehydrogenase